jgi:rhombotail lipoprotein
VLAALATSGCTSPRRFPAATLERTLVPDMGRLSEADIDRLFRVRVRLPRDARVAVAWLNERGSTETVPEAERTRLARRLAEALARAPFAQVSVIPTTTAPATASGGDLDLPALRSAAARFQADVLVLLSIQRNDYDDWNPLAVSYLAVLPLYVVPGNDLAVFASAEACALDVRSGLFLACAQGQGQARRRFVTHIGRERGLRALAREALETALGDVPADLLAGVRAGPTGVAYDTD